MTATVVGETLRRDIHPAEILMPDGAIISGRVFITASRMVVWTDTHGVIQTAVDAELEQPCSVPADRGTLMGHLEVRLADGTTAWINRGRGCGCGSPLKAMAAPLSWT